MKKYLLLITAFIAGLFSVCAQTTDYKSIHQEQLEHYNNLGISAEEYYDINKPAPVVNSKGTSACNLNKIVFGWHPYWSNGLEANYDWNLLSDMSFFSYEVVASTGEASTTHGWATSNAVDEALANGVRVNLCVTLFSNHSTFFASPTAMQTLIDNLISLVQTRGAHGVNIDFEGVSSSLSSDLTSFMIDLCTQMHTQIPGSQVSICTYAVDWSGLFDYATLDQYVDYFTIMGYAYYYSGSSAAGPTAPLYSFTSYNYNLSRTINYHLANGVSKEKLILGLPYYGHEWNTTSSTIPGTTTSSVSSRTYKYVKNNSSGYYSDRLWEPNSFTPYYVYNNGNWRQCFCDDEISLGRRYDLVNMQDVAGIGIWALGYDDGYAQLWDLLRDKFTNCAEPPCSDTIYDMGGPNRVYFDDDDYTFTIAPAGATALSLNFESFDIEAGSGAECNYDYLEIFDGPDVASPSLGVFCNTNGSPGTVVSSGNSLTLNFHSDGATVNDGYMAVWSCVVDTVPPTTSVSANQWETSDFTAIFTDTDNDSVAEAFYQVIDWDGAEWRANSDFGFFNDNYESTLHSDWTNISGDWGINLNHLNQTNEDSSNTNLHIPLAQVTGNTYLYHWQMKIGGAGTNRRAGLHFYCDSPDLNQRGNSYMVYFRVDNNKCQIYKAESNSISIYTDDVCDVNADVWYDYKLIFNTETGEIRAYQNNVLVSSWTDSSPHISGNSLSLRTGNCNVMYDDMKVYQLRGSSQLVTVGPTAEARYQNPDPATPACRIKSIVRDVNNNWSTLEGNEVNIDWTAPIIIADINDGIAADIDTTSNTTQLSANWSEADDPHSGITEYWYCIGDQPGDSNIVAWTNNGLTTEITHTGLSLTLETIYYFSVRAVNSVGLVAVASTSDGQKVVNTVINPVASFIVETTEVCTGDSIHFINQSTDADSFEWSFTGGIPPTSTEANPVVYFPAGNYDIQLIAIGTGMPDTVTQNITITNLPLPVAAFSALETQLYLPSAQAFFINNSTDATAYLWDFGDGNYSTDNAPWHEYINAGDYTVSLIATSSNCGNDTIIIPDFIHVGDGVIADFSWSNSNVCEGVTVNFSNNSQNTTSWFWDFGAGNPATSTDENPAVVFSDGTYDVQLIASGTAGSDTIVQSVTVSILPLAVADFYASSTQIELPNAIAFFTNNSSNADSYIWDFGDGNSSTDVSPWNNYIDTGSYTVTLVAENTDCGTDTLIMTDYIEITDPNGIIEINDFVNIQVYPNPFISQLNVELRVDMASSVKISVEDILGQQVAILLNKSLTAGKHIVTFDTEKHKCENGIYFVKLEFDDFPNQVIQVVKAE